MKKRALSLILMIIILLALFAALPISASASMNINIGDYVQMGTYYGKPILWRCVDIDENGPLMLSDKIICIKPFDASGTNTSDSHGRGYYESGTQGYNRQRYGSNYWADSNMRCWLNSTATAGNVVWACGNPPDDSHVWNRCNEYDDEAGFLTNFTQSERNAMKTVTQKSLLDSYEYSTGSPNTNNSNYHRYSYSIGSVVQNYDTAFSEQVTDTMFLLDVKQVNEVYNNRSILGSDYYIGEPTAECVANSEYTASSLATEKKWYYWLRSPLAGDDSVTVRRVYVGGSVYSSSAYYGSNGVRPAFYLNLSSASVSGGAGTLNSPYTLAEGYQPEDYEYLPPVSITNGEFNFASGKGSANFEYDDNYFADGSYAYNHDLAKMSMRLALSAFGKNIIVAEATDKTCEEKDYSKAYINAENLLEKLGFVSNKDTVGAIAHNEWYEKKPEQNSIGVIAGRKHIDYNGAEDGGKYTLIAVAIRGGGYEAEWGGNFNVGTGDYHAGFELAQEQVIDFIKQYIKDQRIGGNIKLWITGYSRAGATTNLTAAYLDENPEVLGSNVTLYPGDIYAYCFEPPMGIKNPDNESGLYDNIFSIVNEHDFVPMVAMRQWGFDRYGITKYLPTADSTYRYYDLMGDMEEELKKYLADEYIVDDFQFEYILSSWARGKDAGMRNMQGFFLDKVIYKLADAIKNPAYYEENFQDVVMEIMKNPAINSGDFGPILRNIEQELSDRQVLLYLESALVVSNPNLYGRTLYTTIRSAVKDAFNASGIPITNKTVDTITEFISSVGIENFYNLGKNIDGIIQGHRPELCMAWLDVIDENDFSNQRYRSIYLNCPVDLEVYDSNDNLVAAFYDDVPQKIEGSSIIAYLDENGQKVVILPTDEEYRTEVIATADGEVSYSVQEQNAMVGSTKVINYNTMCVRKNDTLTGTAENLTTTEAATYALTSNTVEVAEAEIIEEAVLIAVVVTAEGNGVINGGGEYYKGEFAEIVATPIENEEFLGWYNGEDLVTSETTYRFQVKEELSLVAKFTQNTCEVMFLDNEEDVISVQRIIKGSTVAIPDAPTKDGHRFDGFYTDKEYTTAITETDVYAEDTTIYAKYLEPICSSGFYYFLIDDTTAELVGYENADYELWIPAFIDGYIVTKISNSAFKDAEFEAILIPDTITTIGANAFEGCNYLETVNYTGTGECWNKITIESGNECLTNATIHFGEENLDVYTLGDINGDSVVGTKDVTVLRRYIAGGYDVTVVDEVLDVNRDAAITTKDVTTLRRFIAGGYGIELN